MRTWRTWGALLCTVLVWLACVTLVWAFAEEP
jgi:hypothetical protein